MRQLLTDEILPNGNLKLSLTEDGREELLELIEKDELNDEEILCTLWEFQICNGYKDITGTLLLTESPVLATDMAYDEKTDCDFIDKNTKVYWFPNYMVTNLAKELVDTGYLVFTLAKNS